MGVRLRLIREALGLTQAAFGEIAGVGTTTIAGWESGRNMIDLVHLARAADHSGFSIDYVAREDIGSLRHSLAVKVQQAERAMLSEPPRRRGRPAARADDPIVRDIAEPAAFPRSGTLHDEGEIFIPAPIARCV